MEHDELVGALLTLRSRVADVRLPLETASAPERAARTAPGCWTSSTTTCCRGCATRRTGARGRRRLDRRRQVDGGELAGRRARSARRACCGRPPAGRCSCTTRWTRAGSAPTGCCRRCPARTRPASRGSRARGRAAAGGLRGAAGRAGAARRARRRLGRGGEPRPRRPAARRRRRLAVRHDRRAVRRRRPVGAAGRRRPPRARTSRSCWTGWTPAPRRRSATHLRRMLDEPGLAAATVLVVPEVALEDGLLPEARRRADRRLPHPDGDGPGRPRRRARRDLGRRGRRRVPARARPRRAPPTSSGRRTRACARRSTAAYATAAAQVAARDVGRDAAARRGAGAVAGRASAPASCSGRSSRACPGCATASCGFVRGRRPAEPALVEAVAHGLSAVIQDAAEDAAETRALRVAARPGGPRAARRARAVPGVERTCARGRRSRCAAWQGDVLALVETEGADKRTTARALSYGVNGLGAVLMVAVFASTGGLTGAEVGIVGGVGAARAAAARGGLRRRRRAPAHAGGARAAWPRARTRCWTRRRRRFTRQLDATGARGRDGRRPAGVGGGGELGDGGTDRGDRVGGRRAPGRWQRAPARDGGRRPLGGCARPRGAGAPPVVEPLVPGRRVSASAGSLTGRVAALDEAVGLARGRLPDAALDAPAAVVAQARDRAALSGEYTVVALAGATGSGKSSLLNALAGRAHRGAGRPSAHHRAAGRGDRPRQGRRHGRTAPTSSSTGSTSASGTSPASRALGVGDRPGAARPARPRLGGHRAPRDRRAPLRARRPAGLGRRPAEVRRRRPARPLPARAARTTPGSSSWCSTRRTGWPPTSSGRCLADLRRLAAEDGLRRVAGAGGQRVDRRGRRGAAGPARRGGAAPAGGDRAGDRPTCGWRRAPLVDGVRPPAEPRRGGGARRRRSCARGSPRRASTRSRTRCGGRPSGRRAPRRAGR